MQGCWVGPVIGWPVRFAALNCEHSNPTDCVLTKEIQTGRVLVATARAVLLFREPFNALHFSNSFIEKVFAIS